MSTKKYKEIGKRLQDARIKKGWTLDDVQLKLQISKRYLMALEAGATDDLPGDYYTQSLIKQYANLLEIEVGTQSLKSEPNSIKEWRREHATITSRSQRDAQQQKSSVLQGLIRQHPWVMGSVLVLVVWLLVWGAFNDMASRSKSTFEVPKNIKVTNNTVKESKNSTNSTSSVKNEEKASSSSESKKDVVISKVDENADSLKVKLNSGDQKVDLLMKTGNEQSWNSITALKPTQSTTWQGVIKANDSKSVSLQKDSTYTLKIGNSTGFEGTIGGEKLPKSQSNSIVRNITIEVS